MAIKDESNGIKVKQKRIAAKDRIGQRFGKLTIIEIFNDKKSMATCLCDCGNTKDIPMEGIVGGRTKSCGCFRKEATRARQVKHGMTRKHPVYNTWQCMKARCSDKNNKAYKHYIAKGISVCEGWANSFENFLEDMGFPENGFSIDRIDNEKGYSPENCRWATRKEQQNNRSNTIWLTFNGETKIVSDWAKQCGLKPSTIRERLKSGWSVERALTTPVKY